jgi:hypothetical protein
MYFEHHPPATAAPAHAFFFVSFDGGQWPAR